jgi:hypothetical protein
MLSWQSHPLRSKPHKKGRLPMKKARKMETLNDELFAPLTTEEIQRVGGGNNTRHVIFVFTLLLGIKDAVVVDD